MSEFQYNDTVQIDSPGCFYHGQQGKYLFTEYASALDLLGYYEQYAPTEMGRLHAEAGVQHYREVLVSIVVTKAVR